jgi:hypothetical protein
LIAAAAPQAAAAAAPAAAVVAAAVSYTSRPYHSQQRSRHDANAQLQPGRAAVATAG